eukprot:GHVP01027243.1.p1 GENE.GHVP01027243.1~~GHVP01027243.1.p1  ORF type:complete len:100 (-),score=10.72 GHVP01027243.1:260-559(-)
MSMEISPGPASTLGCQILLQKFTFGGTSGYSKGNLKWRMKFPSSNGDDFGPMISARHCVLSEETGNISAFFKSSYTSFSRMMTGFGAVISTSIIIQSCF